MFNAEAILFYFKNPADTDSFFVSQKTNAILKNNYYS